MEAGQFGLTAGPIMASSNEFSIVVKGKGTHAGMPNLGIDPVMAAVQLAQSLQTIITRNRNILLRATMPLALGIGAGWTVLPVTMRNVSDLAWKYEQRFPAVAESHIKLREGIQKGVSFAKVHKDVGVRYVDEKVTDAREAVEGWVKQGK